MVHNVNSLPVAGAVNAKSMPVILHPEDYDRWLTADYEEAVAMAVPFPSQLMAVERVEPEQGALI